MLPWKWIGRVARGPAALLLLAIVGLAAAAQGFPGPATAAAGSGAGAALGPRAGSTVPAGCTWVDGGMPDFPARDTYLFGIAALAPDNAWTVGSTADTTLVAHWDGTTWTRVTSPNPGSTANQLDAITALAPDNLWAVGHYEGAWVNSTLVEHWDGQQWSVVPSADAGSPPILVGVAAAGPADIWAVGHDYPPARQGFAATLTEHWNGTAWSVVPSFETVYHVSQLAGVAALSANDVWAVGFEEPSDTELRRPLIAHWDGTARAEVPSPVLIGASLAGVAFTAPTDGWAVGTLPDNVLLAEHWDGQTWSTVPTPPSAGSYAYLTAITALAPNNVWAVGYELTIPEATIVLHWNGQVWGRIPSVSLAGWANRLLGLAASGPDDLWGAGYLEQTFGGPFQPFVLHAQGACAEPSPTPTASLTPTATGTPPTSTSTRTPTITPTPTPTSCGDRSAYTITMGTATLVPASTDSGNHCDDCLTTISLPFPVTLYDQTFPFAQVSSNGLLAFLGGDGHYNNTCLPDSVASYAIFPHWDDLTTANAGYGIYTRTEGAAPQRIFDIEWRAQYHPGSGSANFEVRLYENAPLHRFDVILGTLSDGGRSATIGVQRDTGSPVTQYSCNTAVPDGTLLIFQQPSCNPPTPPPTATSPLPATSTDTPGPPRTTGTPTPTAGPGTPTGTPPAPEGTASPAPPPPTPTGGRLTATPRALTATAPPLPLTPSPGPSPTTCPLHFSDVQPTDYFATPVVYLACRGVISGYADGTFRPTATTTRAQMVKIVVLGFATPLVTPSAAAATFADVPPTHPFFAMIETAAAGSIVAGYACGGAGEPCDGLHRPYFRPYAAVTRGQLAKIAAGAAGWPLLTPSEPTFTDVLPGSAFYRFVETAVCHGVVSGYADGTFRPGAGATRGQIAKIVYLAITGGGHCPRTQIR